MIRFEVCAANIASCHAARLGGAHRIELCSGLDVGGLTPSPALIQAAIKTSGILVNVLIRPREGDFCFSEEEIEIMEADIVFCRESGANGVVLGALLPDGTLNQVAMKKWIAAAGNMELVFHRAFDVAMAPFKILEQLFDLGVHRILTSGQAESAFEGRFFIQKMIEKAKNRIEIMPGAGIHAGNIASIFQTTGAKSFHFTAKEQMKMIEKFNHLDNLPPHFWQSNPQLICETIAAVQSL